MGNFNRGGKKFGGRPSMTRAICSDCGDSCEIPFKPKGDRPVFCSDCFGKQNSRGDRPRKFGGDRGDRRERASFGGDRQMHSAVCAKCDKGCEVPFRPTAGKPIYCNDCFEKGGKGKNDLGVLMEQVRILNDKVDKIMGILDPSSMKEKTKKPKVEEEKAPKKSEKVKKEVTPKKKVKAKKEKVVKKVAKTKKVKAKAKTKKKVSSKKKK